MANWTGRAGRLWVVGVLAIVAAGVGVGPAAAEGADSCARVFAVAEGGQLVEIPSCPETSSFGSAVEVDAADWRGYSAIFAVRDGGAAIVYAVTADGELWWRRQEAAGAALSAPARVGLSVNWNQRVVFASRPGYLHVGEQRAPIRTFRHQEWAAGGVAVSEAANLFNWLHGPLITGLAAGSSFAIGIGDGMNFQVWRTHQMSEHWDEDMWFMSGRLPAGLASVTGDGYRFHAVNSAGEIVLLSQTSGSPGGQPPCHSQNTEPWEVTARAPGDYLRVVVPVSDTNTGPPDVGPPLVGGDPECELGGDEATPWEWQASEA